MRVPLLNLRMRLSDAGLRCQPTKLSWGAVLAALREYTCQRPRYVAPWMPSALRDTGCIDLAEVVQKPSREKSARPCRDSGPLSDRSRIVVISVSQPSFSAAARNDETHPIAPTVTRMTTLVTSKHAYTTDSGRTRISFAMLRNARLAPVLPARVHRGGSPPRFIKGKRARAVGVPWGVAVTRRRAVSARQSRGSSHRRSGSPTKRPGVRGRCSN